MPLRSFGLDQIYGKPMRSGIGKLSGVLARHSAYPYLFEQHLTGQRRSSEISGLTASRAINVAVTFPRRRSAKPCFSDKMVNFSSTYSKLSSTLLSPRHSSATPTFRACAPIELSLQFHLAASKTGRSVPAASAQHLSFLMAHWVTCSHGSAS
ncbi:uncharacterized protein M421DRAFT_320812 [Didymella exigua CBS 183.55]|uniref:Uncharacterized protein n=1 Tax=Didymella exigua CBS 183.55 TaxID=1150837 RepID=A0A6A5RTI0_9PLEO|nr:uncharacterized protein M421DRAFT_320812 [Didymella exigua CBS 183.55]KAF1931795.1 hypothetical protein M421DRAFT_320812 [Didymella exigua CBS 183.55]